MTCSALAPRPQSRSRLVPGLSLKQGDILAKRYRLESLASLNAARARVSAVDIETKREVVVDVDAVDVALDGDALDELRLRLLAEARKATTLSGPHVARLLDVGVTTDGHPFVVRENVDGDLETRTLASFLADGPSIDTADAVDVIVDLCDALAESHAIGLVHGAISAAEVHLAHGPQGPARVKLAELGTSTFTRIMTLVGLAPPAGARAPESFQRGPGIDERADVFALGVLLYTMLAGAEPFSPESPSGMDLAVALDEPASLAGVPDELADLVDACLKKNADDRPKSVVALAKGLAPFASPSREATLMRIAGFAKPTPPFAESTPTLVVGPAYQRFAQTNGLPSDADLTAPREVIAAASSLDLVIEVGPSVRDVTLAMNDAPPRPTPQPTAESTVLMHEPPVGDRGARPTPLPQSIPPMVMSYTPNPLPVVPRPLRPTVARAKRSSWTVSGSLIAAGCAGLAIAAAVGALAGFRARNASAPQATAAIVQPVIAKEAPPPAAVDLPNAAPAVVTPSSLANAPQAVPVATTPVAAKRAAPKKEPASRAEPAPAPAAAPEKPEKSEKSEKIEKQPEPKENGDDLRRYLDERR